ncbi:hypothetical protein [uncultured Pseudoteredinibacter sp.]|uniref:hypothetical protein n=1 Tax=uncultured Pseudoteredinibacter sp. TaxID=1641701 RepID=UPI00261C88A7|nr:hypothetical protein [uncultured Pseudoteredinibacter sp.]
MLKTLLSLILLSLIACSASPQMESLSVDALGDGRVQTVRYYNISRKDAALFLDHVVNEQLQYGRETGIDLSSLSDAEVSRSLTLDELYYIVAIQGRVRAYIRECWGGECRFIFATTNAKICGFEVSVTK